MDRYVVIGNPIAHSKSPVLHRLFAEQTAQSMQYDTLLAPLDDLAGCASAFSSRDAVPTSQCPSRKTPIAWPTALRRERKGLAR